VHLRVVLADGVGDILEHGGLAGFRRADDQAALPLADRGDQVQQAGAQDAGTGFQVKAFFREDGRQAFKGGPALGQLRAFAADGFHP